MSATILYPLLKGENVAMDEQDKINTDLAVAETVDTDPVPPSGTLEKEGKAAAPADVSVEKEAEAAPPPTEVIYLSKMMKRNG
jgi:hypothetical protein